MSPQPVQTAPPTAAATTSAPARPARTLGLAAVALFVAAANLRPAIAAVSPLVDTIRSDLGLSAVGVALLTTLPTLAMGLCAPLAASIGRRQGLHRGVLIGLAVIALATAARIGGESTWLQLCCATAAGAGIAIAQTLLPAVVRTRFQSRASLMTGVYTAALGLGAVVAVGVSVPLADALDSWPAALASWAVLALVGIVLWSAAEDSLALDGNAGPAGPATRGLPWREATAWRIAAISAANSALYYCELAWLAPLIHNDGGRSTASAGDLLTAMLVMQVGAMLVLPALLGEKRDRRIGLLVTSLMTAAGFFGFALSAGTGTWAWIVLVGVGHGGLFSLVLALPATASRDAGHASRLSGMAFFVGYGCAAAAPVLVGWLRDLSGNFDLAFAILGAIALLSILPIAQLSPRRLEQMREPDA
jgi:CP family cyanate transporter-like MFS transporter